MKFLEQINELPDEEFIQSEDKEYQQIFDESKKHTLEILKKNNKNRNNIKFLNAEPLVKKNIHIQSTLPDITKTANRMPEQINGEVENKQDKQTTFDKIQAYEKQQNKKIDKYINKLKQEELNDFVREQEERRYTNAFQTQILNKTLNNILKYNTTRQKFYNKTLQTIDYKRKINNLTSLQNNKNIGI